MADLTHFHTFGIAVQKQKKLLKSLHEQVKPEWDEAKKRENTFINFRAGK